MVARCGRDTLEGDVLRGIAVVMMAAGCLTAASVRGKLATGEKPVLKTASGEAVRLFGDKATMKVLHDKRLRDADFEVVGRFRASGEFEVGPIHEKSMFVHKGGKKLLISYWCEVCSIRTYEPGQCMCCQEETELDLKETIDP